MEDGNLLYQLTQYEIDNNIARIASMTPYTFRDIKHEAKERSFKLGKRLLDVSQIMLSEVLNGSFKIEK